MMQQINSTCRPVETVFSTVYSTVWSTQVTSSPVLLSSWWDEECSQGPTPTAVPPGDEVDDEVTTSYSTWTNTTSTIRTIRIPPETESVPCASASPVQGGGMFAASLVDPEKSPIATAIASSAAEVDAPSHSLTSQSSPPVASPTGLMTTADASGASPSNDTEGTPAATEAANVSQTPPVGTIDSPQSTPEEHPTQITSPINSPSSLDTSISLASSVPAQVLQPIGMSTGLSGSPSVHSAAETPWDNPKLAPGVIGGAVVGGSIGAILCVVLVLYGIRYHRSRLCSDRFEELGSVVYDDRDDAARSTRDTEKSVLASRFSLPSIGRPSLRPASDFGGQSSRTSRFLSLYTSIRHTLLPAPLPGAPNPTLPAWSDPCGGSGQLVPVESGAQPLHDVSSDHVDFTRTPPGDVREPLPARRSWFTNSSEARGPMEYLQPDRLPIPTPDLSRLYSGSRASSQYSQDSVAPDVQSGVRGFLPMDRQEGSVGYHQYE